MSGLKNSITMFVLALLVQASIFQVSIFRASILWASSENSSLPNVVILLADDLGSKDIGCYGGPVKTPALDSLAANGVRFTNFYSGAPVCSTARATLLTGRHHLRTGVYTVIQDHLHDMHLRKQEVTLAEILKENNYDTVHLGKWHLGTPFRRRAKPWLDEHGFDFWFATDLNAAPSHRDPVNFWRNRKRVGAMKGYACQIVVDEAVTWLEEKRDGKTPFFLNIWFHEPHAPLAAPDEIVSQYGELNDQAAIYSGTVDNTDRAISRLLKKLKQLGALENTIIIYMSDHGSYRQDRNGELRGKKGSLLEGGIRTPGIVYWPRGIKGGLVDPTPAGAIDILPTICGLVGVEKPKDVQLDGADLSPLLTGDRSDFKRSKPLTWHSPLSQPAVAVRDGKYSLVGWRSSEYPKDQAAIKMVMNDMRVILERELDRKLTPSELWDQCYNSPIKTPEWNRLRGKFVVLNTFQEAWIPFVKSGSGGISRFQLFDLSVDPGQKNDIAKQFPAVAERLKQSVLKVNADVLKEAPDWGASRQGESPNVHRLQSKSRSPFDAFVYVNRISIKPEPDESQEDLAGRILGRLANQEGRVLVKLPPAMDRRAYDGFKVALESGKQFHSGRCFSCHRLPAFGHNASDDLSPSLRNRSFSIERLNKVLDNKIHSNLLLDKKDINNLHELLKTLTDISDGEFRNQITKSTVLDTSEEKQ